MRVLLIDEDPFFRAMVRKYRERDLPEIELTELDPRASSFSQTTMDWSQFEVVLLSHGETTLDWLTSLGETVPRVPIVYFTETGTEELAARARRLGAYQVLRKEELKGQRLAQVIAQALAASDTDGTEEALVSAPQIEGYKVASQIGEGAMSRVFLAERESDHLTVVLKVIELDLVNHHAYVKRFVEEAELVSELSSPHVVRIFEQAFTDEFGFIAMEFFPRGDLKHRIEYGISPADAVHCLANIAYGLEAIHRVGIVHRDLKPANVMFRHDDTLALADFGISRRLASESELAKSGSVLGTPHYMSPEQGQGKLVDVRNDIYSLGIIFFEMLTGEKPFHGDTPAAVVYEHINTPIPKLPASLKRYQGLLETLLAKDPEKRFESASALVASL